MFDMQWSVSRLHLNRPLTEENLIKKGNLLLPVIAI